MEHVGPHVPFFRSIWLRTIRHLAEHPRVLVPTPQESSSRWEFGGRSLSFSPSFLLHPILDKFIASKELKPRFQTTLHGFRHDGILQEGLETLVLRVFPNPTGVLDAQPYIRHGLGLRATHCLRRCARKLLTEFWKKRTSTIVQQQGA